MKTIIAGSRGALQKDVFMAMEAVEWTVTEVVSGCARGADTFGEWWAKSWRIPVARFPANWEDHGKAAGPIRNRQMAQYAEALVAVWDGRSPGTRNMIQEAQKRGLRVYIHKI